MIDLLSVDFSDYVKVEKLSEQNIPDSFSASVQEYSDYLLNRALKSQESMIANTYLLTENDSGKVMAFISFVCDSVSFTVDEKSDVSLADFPFSNFPALKVAQLAVSVEFKKKYINIGSFLLSFARIQAFMLNEFTACRLSNAPTACKIRNIATLLRGHFRYLLLYDSRTLGFDCVSAPPASCGRSRPRRSASLSAWRRPP